MDEFNSSIQFDKILYDEDIEEWYTEPTDEDSTALGAVPEEAEKGTIGPNNPWVYYGYSGYYS